MNIFKTSVITLCLLIFFSCDKENEVGISEVITTDEAVEIIAGSLSQSSSGVTAAIEESVAVTKEAVDASGGRKKVCGYNDAETLSWTNASGSSVTYNYIYNFTYALACTGEDSPQNMDVVVDFNGQFDGPRMTSSNTGDAAFQINGFDEGTTYSVNGSYERNGTFQSKIKNQSSGTSTISITLEGVSVNKTTRSINEGTASITLNATVSSKNFSTMATVIFRGNRTADVTLNGKTYSINLTTGTISEL